MPDNGTNEEEKMSFNLLCPFCQHKHDDPFEVLNPDRLDVMRCEKCKAKFSFAIMECHRCAHEQVFSWPQAPSADALDMLICEECNRTLRYQNATITHEQVQ
jgi:ribosomal protein L40E